MDDPTPVPVSGDDPVGAWLADRADEVIETSCARIYLTGGRALKVKRPVSLGFLDFTTLAKRRWALDRELAMNRRQAPDIYRAVRAITREPGGAFALDGDGPAVEWALEMRRFESDAVLLNHPDRVDGDLAETLGRVIARAHRDAPVTPEGGGVKALGYTVSSNAEHLQSLAHVLGETATARVIAATKAALIAQAPLLDARRQAGFARRCHGDLHLGNILLENGAPILFDCIEFNDALSEIDVFYDLAFLIMDLHFRGRAAAANRVLGAYLDEAARTFTPGFWDGLAALPLMLSARATVRAHVNGATGDLAVARDYLAAAESHLDPASPRLIAVGGLSGSGKTTRAREIAPRIGATPGAVILRSDEIRKRQWGAAPLERLAPAAYSPAASQRVFAEMFETGARLLGAGRSVVLDATFLGQTERREAEALAARAGIPFEGVWLEAEEATLRARIAARASDASDADAAVLQAQRAQDPGPITWRRTDG